MARLGPPKVEWGVRAVGFDNEYIMTEVLGKTEDARKYSDLALRIRDAFNREFFDADAGLYRPTTQTAMSCALYHGLVPPESYQKVLNNLVAMIEKNDGHLDAGILGTKYLIDALTAGGRADVVEIECTMFSSAPPPRTNSNPVAENGSIPAASPPSPSRRAVT